MHLKRRKKLRPTIPLSSMADIAFLLLVFFIVTSAMNMEETADIRLPAVPKIEVIEQDKRLDLWLDKNGTLKLLRRPCSLMEAEIRLLQQVRLVPDTIIFLNGDRRCPFRKTEEVLQMLTRAGAVRVVFVSTQEDRDAAP